MSYRESFTEDLLKVQAPAWPWIAKLRQEAYERFKSIGFPTRKLESWKYVTLDPLLNASFVSSDKNAAPELDLALSKELSFSEGSPRIVFVNGVYSETLSSINFLPHGVFLNRLSENMEFTPEIVQPYLTAGLEEESNAFSLINLFSFKDGAFVYVPANSTLDEPLHILFVESGTSAEAVALYPKILIVLGEHATAAVTLNFIGGARGKYFRNAHAQIHLGKSSALDCNIIQRESKEAFSFLSSRYFLEKESRLNVTSFSQGGLVTRNDSEVKLIGERASVSLKGLSVLSGESQVFHHAAVHHLVPHCVSRQFYKNILADKSKSEFDSLVHVGHNAVKSDSNQLNKNLLLSDFAQEYSRPKLKIDNDDVACTHGATVGQLQETELFYLRSRGFSEASARFVLTYGFAEEILEGVKPEPLKTRLEALVSEELKKVIR